MFRNSIFIIVLLFAISTFAQQDTIYNPFSDKRNSFEINAKLIKKNIEFTNDSNADLSYLFYKKEQPLPLSYSFDVKKYLNPFNEYKNPMLLPKTHEEDKDVMVVKHFDGRNTTNKTFKTSQNLGTIQSNTKFVRIEYKDFGLVDGDRVRVFLNEKEVDGNVHLDGLYYTLHINLDKHKGYNKIDIQAINQGYVGPNTAEFIVYDDRGNVIAHKAWNLLKGEIATLGVVKF